LNAYQLNVKVGLFNVFEHTGEHGVGVPPVVANAANAKDEPLPEVCVLDLGHSDVKPVANAI
jgi:hypothetical protein